MVEKHRFSKQCVYTLRKRDNLDFIYRVVGLAHSEKTRIGKRAIRFL